MTKHHAVSDEDGYREALLARGLLRKYVRTTSSSSMV